MHDEMSPRPSQDPPSTLMQFLAAQAVTLPARDDGTSVVVATTNVGHLNRFVPVRRGQEIQIT